jgi:hypothetical protein
VHLSHVKEPTPIKKTDVVEYFRPRLADGVRQPTLAKARAFLSTIPLTPAAQASLRPTPSASPKATPKASAT